MTDLPDYVLVNRELWDKDVEFWAEVGEGAWVHEPSWGVWGIPEAEVSLLPDGCSL